MILLLEDYQFVHPAFLEMVNSLLSSGGCQFHHGDCFKEKIGSLGNKASVLCAATCFLCLHLSSGEVPGLYSPEELEPLLSPLKDAASQDGFTGPLYNYFSFSQSPSLSAALAVCHPLFSCPCSPRENVSLRSLLDLLPCCLLYNVLQKRRSVAEVEAAACESNQKGSYFKMKHFSSALLKSCSEFPLCLLAASLGSICAPLNFPRNPAEPPHCSHHGLLQFHLHHQLRKQPCVLPQVFRPVDGRMV